MAKKLISVIIVNWNGKHHLGECLSSLTKQTIKNFEIIFIDNGSTDESTAFVNRKFPDVKIVELKKNEGFCRANNIGLKHASGEFIALLNNDTRVEANWLEELAKAMVCDPKIAIWASVLVNYFQPELIDTAGDGYDICGVGFKIANRQPVSRYQEKREVFGACAGAVLYRRSMIDKIGLFDEDFFAVGEDIDLSFRAKLSGFKCVYVPKAIVHHKVGQTIGSNSNLLLYHSRRNIEYTYFKNMPLALLLLTFPMHLLYNLLTFIQALSEGRIHIFLKAKRDFFLNFGKILKKRKNIQTQRKIPLKSLLSLFSKNYLWLKIKEDFRGSGIGD